MGDIHVIATDKPSLGKYLVFNKEGNLCIWETNTMGSQRRLLRQNIYITSDEEIKEGNWYYDSFLKEISRANDTFAHKCGEQLFTYDNKYVRKIIATTDQDLINDGVQGIDDSFLEWFINNPTCEEVEVENSSVVKEHIFDGSNDGEVIWEHKIIIPQEEPKQAFDKSKYISGIDPYDKTETLEEAAEFWDAKQTILEFGKPYVSTNRPYAKAFIEGANWQQENSYSEEEVKTIASNLFYNMANSEKGIIHTYESFDKWFEQFKKG